MAQYLRASRVRYSNGPEYKRRTRYLPFGGGARISAMTPAYGSPRATKAVPGDTSAPQVLVRQLVIAGATVSTIPGSRSPAPAANFDAGNDLLRFAIPMVAAVSVA